MKIIADGGSTKIRWAIQVGTDDWDVVTTSGINPLILSDCQIEKRLYDELTPRIRHSEIDEIIYYGAGCIPSVAPSMAVAITTATGIKNVSVESDMLGAARAICGHNDGIACILGTGSNSCLFDGRKIVDTIPPLGYVLGDEGSGASIGRRLLSGIFKRWLPEDIRTEFIKSTGLTRTNVIERVYRQNEANKFLASLVPFVRDHISNSAIHDMVTDEFTRFITINVMPYSPRRGTSVNFTGSLSEIFRPQLTLALDRCGLKPGTITADPILGLIQYHTV